MSFIKRIEQRRCEIGVTQLRLCQKADINPSTYTRLLTSKVTPQTRTCKKLTQALRELAQEETFQ